MKAFQIARAAACLLTAMFIFMIVQGMSETSAHKAPSQASPTIINARMKGSKIIISGVNFTSDTLVLINGQVVRTVIDGDSPTTTLVAKKINKATEMGVEVQLQLRTSGNQVSEPFAFFVGQTIGFEDGGKTIPLSVGEKVMLVLKHDAYEWTPSVEKPSVLQKIQDPALVQGAQGIYQAQSPGTTRIQALGELPCSKLTPPCAAPSIEFEVTIIVQN